MKNTTYEIAMAEVFRGIYLDNAWQSDETRSGPGSERWRLDKLIESLRLLIAEKLVSSIVDAPCGEFGWMQSVLQGHISYTGIDIVADLADQNQRKHGSDNRTFRQGDITQSEIPYADLLICRDALVHIPNSDCLGALNNIRASGALFCALTTFLDINHNEDIQAGEWRPVNLCLPPFNLPVPSLMIPDASEDPHAQKYLGIWSAYDLPILDAGFALT